MIERWADVILIRQSFFGLPWLLMGGLLPLLQGVPLDGGLSRWPWLIAAFFGARCAGMGLNRLIDQEVDRRNPRTMGRALPMGRVSRAEVLLVVLLCLALFLVSCWMVGWQMLLCGIGISGLLVAYPFAKRYTAWCHGLLGLIHMLSPVCAYVAVSGQLAVWPCLVGLAVGVLIAANDVLYACQDIEVDRRYGLKSVPAMVGAEQALRISVCLYAVAGGLLGALGVGMGLGVGYWAGVVGVMVCLGWLQWKFREGSLSWQALFTWANTVPGAMLLLGLLVEVMWRGLS